jgi:hypothetical protein
MTTKLLFAVLLSLVVLALPGVAAEPEPSFSSEQLEFFEKKVRPLLVTHCRECHGPDKQKGGLRVDSRAALTKGGESGAAIVPGKPDMGYFVDAINYGDTYKMPPRGKLPAEAIATLTEWVRQGAAWPKEAGGDETKSSKKEIPYDERMQHWSFQPIQSPTPPPVKDESWIRSPIDRFILAKLEAAGLKPNPPADEAVLLRRITLDLTGIPPEEKLKAESRKLKENPSTRDSAAFSSQLSALLASPRYGERWARHWLDLVRYAETCGHEFDFELPEAFEYRDYVIRALNADVPYDQFVIEHIAGDLLPQPRRNPIDNSNESIIGTGFFFLGEGKHSPVDIRADECERVDNQIDVLSKTFLGLTLSCARCHDHKFDPILAKDYYGLAGFLQSSRFDKPYVEDPTERHAAIRELVALKAKQPTVGHAPRVPSGSTGEKASPKTISSDSATSRHVPNAIAPFNDSTTFGEWRTTGEAFGPGPTQAPTIHVSQRDKKWFATTVPAGVAHSGSISPRLRGTLRSPTFKIEQPVIHYRIAGVGGAKFNLIIDSFQHIRNPIYGGLTFAAQPADKFVWHRQDVSKWVGHMAYVELIDDGDGWGALDAVVQGDVPKGFAESVLTEQAIEPTPELSAWFDEFAQVEQRVHYRRRVMAMADGTPEDEYVLVRGNPRLLGEQVPRQFVSAVSHSLRQPAKLTGSGRLELARQIVDPKNPLTARVIVNRLWKHHFGVGLVPTVDDFGHMGMTPSHPELLDFLATELVKNGWSLKHMHRLMLDSNTYRMSSAVQPQALTIDPTNKLLHRMNVRRLEAEAIRDCVLAVAGSLNDKMYGPSVMPYLTPFMDGRGRPGRGGPPDGEGRRSVYLGVRRNFLNPLFLAFDYPVPFSTIGRRTVSNVPAQALAMMNNPLVRDQSAKWSARLLEQSELSDRERIERMYQTALGRQPDAEELKQAESFIQAAVDESGRDARPQAWTDLCHVMFNLKEFIFVP